VISEPIARDIELAAIEAFLDAPAEPLRTLVLEGEPGIGKSTLWQAGVRAAIERSYLVVQARPSESEQGMAYVALGDLFGSIPPALVSSLPGPQRQAVSAAVLLDEGTAGPVDPRALGVAILALLPRVADGRPVLIAVDDCQWLDLPSASTLGFVLRRLEGTRVHCLLSRRSGSGAATAIEDAAAVGDMGRLSVGAMSLGGIQAVLSAQLDYHPTRAQLLRIHEASGGNPFYALELARAQGPAPAAQPEGPLVVPPSLERLVRARLTALDPATRQALLLIASHGRFPVASLPRLGIAESVLAPAWAANLIEDNGGVIRFSHPMLPSLLYQDAAGEERRLAHRSLAGIVADPVQHAYHVALGADGPDAGTSGTLEEAARTAFERGLALAAADLAAHAARLTPSDDPASRFRRGLLGGRAHLVGGDASRARAIAIDLVAQGRSGAERASALILWADAEPPGVAIPLLERALEEGPGFELEAGAHRRLADWGRFARTPAWAEAHAQAFVQLADRLGSPSLRTSALVILAGHEFDRGSPTAISRARQAYDLAAEAGQVDALGEAVIAIAYMLTWSRDTRRAIEFIEREIALWRERDERVRLELVGYLSHVEMLRGRWPEALEHNLEYMRFVDPQTDRPSDRHVPATIALYRGDLAGARDHARRSIAGPDREFREDFQALLATADLRDGRPAAAAEQFELAERTADAHGQMDPSLRYWRADFAEALARLGRYDDARLLLDTWEADAVRLDRHDVLADVRRSRGILAAATGDLDLAVRWLEEAAAMHASSEDRLGRGRALLALGDARLRLRARRAAREDLQAAVEIFAGLGAAGWEAAAREALGRIGGRQRHVGLSPSERRVAELAAKGRTNSEIAAALYLSERTVAGHLTNAYAKLGLRSRSELTRRILAEEQSR
jgi:DNA-binding CsgD family transcriptional regulator